ncbi:hypothetical protein J2S08_000329 [Bacillus chungangensis]|uniref:Uncharacterized protein n=1 Tax=Bacillus chungangensis TaxID=587633 RepID=A0ABT9WMW9_9BACI|nr:hypothetical protein [Bacillus chungangensis]
MIVEKLAKWLIAFSILFVLVGTIYMFFFT